MLDHALTYRKAVVKVTQDLDNDLRMFELSAEEWAIVEQLRDVLKVSISAS